MAEKPFATNQSSSFLNAIKNIDHFLKGNTTTTKEICRLKIKIEELGNAHQLTPPKIVSLNSELGELLQQKSNKEAELESVFQQLRTLISNYSATLSIRRAAIEIKHKNYRSLINSILPNLERSIESLKQKKPRNSAKFSESIEERVQTLRLVLPIQQDMVNKLKDTKCSLEQLADLNSLGGILAIYRPLCSITSLMLFLRNLPSRETILILNDLGASLVSNCAKLIEAAELTYVELGPHIHRIIKIEDITEPPPVKVSFLKLEEIYNRIAEWVINSRLKLENINHQLYHYENKKLVNDFLCDLQRHAVSGTKLLDGFYTNDSIAGISKEMGISPLDIKLYQFEMPNCIDYTRTPQSYLENLSVLMKNPRYAMMLMISAAICFFVFYLIEKIIKSWSFDESSEADKAKNNLELINISLRRLEAEIAGNKNELVRLNKKITQPNEGSHEIKSNADSENLKFVQSCIQDQKQKLVRHKDELTEAEEGFTNETQEINNESNALQNLYNQSFAKDSLPAELDDATYNNDFVLTFNELLNKAINISTAIEKINGIIPEKESEIDKTATDFNDKNCQKIELLKDKINDLEKSLKTNTNLINQEKNGHPLLKNIENADCSEIIEVLKAIVGDLSGIIIADEDLNSCIEYNTGITTNERQKRVLSGAMKKQTGELLTNVPDNVAYTYANVPTFVLALVEIVNHLKQDLNQIRQKISNSDQKDLTITVAHSGILAESFTVYENKNGDFVQENVNASQVILKLGKNQRVIIKHIVPTATTLPTNHAHHNPQPAPAPHPPQLALGPARGGV